MSAAKSCAYLAAALLSGAWLSRRGGWRLALGVLVLAAVVGTLTWPMYAAWTRRQGVEVGP